MLYYPVEVAGYKAIATITIDSTKAKEETLAKLEEKLYGTEGSGANTGTDPQLPLPAEVIAMFAE